MCSSELSLLPLSCPRDSEDDGTAAEVCACYSVSSRSQLVFINPAQLVVLWKQRGPVPWDSAMVLGTENVSSETGLVAVGAELTHGSFCFYKISGSHARGAPGQEQTLVLRLELWV